MYDVCHSTNIQLLQPGNNPQAGSSVPKCMKFNSQQWDQNCVSGMMFMQSDGKFVC